MFHMIIINDDFYQKKAVTGLGLHKFVVVITNDMAKALFVYGTLMYPEVSEQLLNRKLSFKQARLMDYEVRTIDNGESLSTYPILKPLKGAWVDGFVISQLSEDDMNILTFYEGD